MIIRLFAFHIFTCLPLFQANAQNAEPTRLFLSESAKPVQPTGSKSSDENIPSFWVGQKIPIAVEVFSETHFSGSTRFDLPDISGAVFYKPEERAIVMSRQIDGTTYSVQRHEFSLYPQRSGTFTIPAFSVRIGIAGRPGEPAIERKAMTTPLEIRAIMPPGAEGFQSLISTTNLKVTESWSPDPNKLKNPLKAGNALKRSITFTAPDVPGMVFPDLKIAEPEGLRIYRNRAEVKDRIDRGSLTGERTDTLTYVCQKEGSYELPAIVIYWWDMNRQQLKTITLPEARFEVLPAPQSPHNETNTDKPNAWSWPFIALAAGIIGLIAFLLLRFRPFIQSHIQQTLETYRTREAAHFKLIHHQNTPASAYQAINTWLQHFSGPPHNTSLEQWTKDLGLEALSCELQQLQYAIVTPSAKWDKAELFLSLGQLRKTLKQKERLNNNKHKSFKLKPLNPM